MSNYIRCDVTGCNEAVAAALDPFSPPDDDFRKWRIVELFEEYDQPRDPSMLAGLETFQALAPPAVAGRLASLGEPPKTLRQRRMHVCPSHELPHFGPASDG